MKNLKKFSEIEKELKSQKYYFAEKYNVSEIGVFGSYARGEATEKSDLDLLVSYKEKTNFFEIFT